MHNFETEEKRAKWFELGDILIELTVEGFANVVKLIVHLGEVLAEFVQGLA